MTGGNFHLKQDHPLYNQRQGIWTEDPYSAKIKNNESVISNRKCHMNTRQVVHIQNVFYKSCMQF